jgi:hypothetical protein
LDCAIKSHYLNPNQISESDFIGARPNAAALAPIAPRTSALPVLSGTKILTAAAAIPNRVSCNEVKRRAGENAKTGDRVGCSGHRKNLSSTM